MECTESFPLSLRVRSPFRTKEFRALEREWRDRLAESGFDDLEDHRGRLRQYDRRTQAFTNRDRVLEFYRKLDHYLAGNPPISEIHRKILQLYSEGKSGPEIVKAVGRCRRQVQAVFSSIKRRLCNFE